MMMLAVLGLIFVALEPIAFSRKIPNNSKSNATVNKSGQTKFSTIPSTRQINTVTPYVAVKPYVDVTPYVAVTPHVLDMLRATGQDEKLAELLGIDDVSLLHANEDQSEDPFLSSNVSPLGDIILTREESERARQGLNFTRKPAGKWRNKVIPYYINPGDFSKYQLNKIHKALEDLSNSLTNLKIRRYQASDENYVYVISGKGCSSNLGRVGNRQIVSLKKRGCLRSGTIQHEFIHAAGMDHEHTRPDRDNFVRVIKENIPADILPNYEKSNSEGYVILGDYDYYSVMHYKYNAPITNKPAFEIYNKTVDTKIMGQRDGPTSIDLQKIDKLYS